MSAPPWIETPAIELHDHVQLDQRFRRIPDPLVRHARRLLDSVMSGVPPKAAMLADLARLRTANRFHAETKALADTVGVPWRQLMLANLSYDLTLVRIGCSTIALPTPDGPVVARNMDWWPEDLLARASCLLVHQRDGELDFAHAGWPGSVGIVTGLSGRGFAVILNAALCEERFRKSGYPVLLHIRRVIEDASGFDEALERLKKTRLVAPALLTLVGSENHQRVVVERTPTRHALRWAEEDQPLVTTNDYRLLQQPNRTHDAEIYRTTCHRFEFLTKTLAGRESSKAASDSELLFHLADQNVRQSITAQHVLIRPRQRKMKLFTPRHLMQS